jgi:hypothetical protein
MGCHEMRTLEQTHKLHREAAMFLGCDQTTRAATIKLLIRKCRADQARAGHAILTHRRNCLTCNNPSRIEF